MKVELKNYTILGEETISEAAAQCRLSAPKSFKRIRTVIRAGHMSALGHASATISVNGISRVCSHQLVRHVFIRYMQQSQRSIQSKPVYIIPPIDYIKDRSQARHIRKKMEYDCLRAYNAYALYLQLGVKKEDARYILPQATSTGMWMSSSLQGWWDFLYGSRSTIDKKTGNIIMAGASRLAYDAQWEIRNVACRIETALTEVYPNIFRRNFS